jgi:hypothetical protein
MLTAQGTLTINAAFLQEIKEENRELRQLLHDCEAALCAPGETPVDSRLAVELLGRLRNQLSLHFALEETYGYFDDAANVTPQLADRALKLRSQHSELFLSLCGIADRAEQMLEGEQTGELASIAQEFGEFHARFQDHEARETELIVQVVNEETGCGD